MDVYCFSKKETKERYEDMIKEMLKRKRENKAITLIALVITIIVLLILAGISIATLTGENGLLVKANEAKEVTEKAQSKEKLKIEVMGSINNSGKFDKDEFKENIKDNLGLTDNDIKDNEDGSISVTVDGNDFNVSTEGEVTDSKKEVGDDASKNKLDPDYEENIEIMEPIDGWQIVGETITSPNYPSPYPEHCAIKNYQTFPSNVVGVKIIVNELFIETDQFNRHDRFTLLDKCENEILNTSQRMKNKEYIIKGNYYKSILLTDWANSYKGFSYNVAITTNPELVKDANIADKNIYDAINTEQKSLTLNFSHFDRQKQVKECEIKNVTDSINMQVFVNYNIPKKENESDSEYAERINQYKEKTVQQIKIYNEKNELIAQQEVLGNKRYCAQPYNFEFQDVPSKLRIEYEHEADIIRGNITVIIANQKVW